MAVITVNGKAGGADLQTDSRFKHWGKLILRPEDVDLSKSNGYSIVGPWATWGRDVALRPGQFLVLASETGSRARHAYDYRLVSVDGDDQACVVSDEAIDGAIATADVTDQQRAAANNSRLYAYALYCSLQMRPGPISQCIMAQATRLPETPQLLAARRAIEALTDDERAALLAELGR